MTARALKRRARARRRLLNSYRVKRATAASVPPQIHGMRKPTCTWTNWLAEESLYDRESRQLCPLWHHPDKEAPVA